MKKFGYVLAALGAIVVAAPSIASAETVVIKRGGLSPWLWRLWRARRVPRITIAAGIADGMVIATRS